MGEVVWKICVCVMCLTVIGGVIADIGLGLGGAQTVTDFLRKNPQWYIMPSAIFICVVILLGIHLFTPNQPPN